MKRQGKRDNVLSRQLFVNIFQIAVYSDVFSQTVELFFLKRFVVECVSFGFAVNVQQTVNNALIVENTVNVGAPRFVVQVVSVASFSLYGAQW